MISIIEAVDSSRLKNSEKEKHNDTNTSLALQENLEPFSHQQHAPTFPLSLPLVVAARLTTPWLGKHSLFLTHDLSVRLSVPLANTEVPGMEECRLAAGVDSQPVEEHPLEEHGALLLLIIRPVDFLQLLCSTLLLQTHG